MSAEERLSEAIERRNRLTLREKIEEIIDERACGEMTTETAINEIVRVVKEHMLAGVNNEFNRGT